MSSASPEQIEQLSLELLKLRQDHEKLLMELKRWRYIDVCMNVACATGDHVPHMFDGRDHGSYGATL